MDTITTLTNCIIITMDDLNTFYPDGKIVIENDHITEIGMASTIADQGKVIDMHGKIIMPGLINTHTHSHSSVFKNTADDLKLMDWLQNAMWPMEENLNYDRSLSASKMSCLEYIQSGITTYVDMFYFAEATAQAAISSGLRCFLAAAVFSRPTSETDDPFGAAERFIEQYVGKEDETLVYPCIGPHAPYSVEEDLWKKCIEISNKYDLLIHTHISETEDENNQIREKTGGLSPAQWLEKMGVFDRPVLAAHSVHLSEDDLEIYARHHVAVSYNPVSNLKLVSGVMPLKKMVDKNIAVTLGTDGAQSNNSMDLLRDLRTGNLIQKMLNDDATFLTAEQSLRMITIDAAKVLRMDQEIGSLEIGKKADIIAFDNHSPRLVPFHKYSLKNIYATLTYSACGADVTDSIVNGRWVMKDREILTMNRFCVEKDAEITAHALVEEGHVKMDY